MKDISAGAAAALAGLTFAVAWLLASFVFSYLSRGEVSASTLVGAVVAGTVFGVLNYVFWRRS